MVEWHVRVRLIAASSVIENKVTAITCLSRNFTPQTPPERFRYVLAWHLYGRPLSRSTRKLLPASSNTTPFNPRNTSEISEHYDTCRNASVTTLVQLKKDPEFWTVVGRRLRDHADLVTEATQIQEAGLPWSTSGQNITRTS